ncbi:MAG: acyl-CoA dehydrogenase domain-containing protein [Alphaproteobacteria bacterium]
MAKNLEMKSEEKIALELGTVGFEGDIVNGQTSKGWSELRRLTSIRGVSAEERSFIDNEVKELCAMIDDWALWNSEEQMVSDEIMNFMKEKGFFGLGIPKEYGGKEFSEQAHGEIVQMLASRSFAAAIPVMVINSLGPGKLVLEYGTQEQKDEILPLIASGHYVTCFGATETGAGSDLFGGMATEGILQKDENGELSIHIKDADKRYITLAPIANLLGMAYILKDPDDLLGTGNENIGMTFSLIPRETKGLNADKRLIPNDIPFPNGVIQGSFDIPAGSIIGGIDAAGKGQQYLQECLAIGRGITLPNGSAGALKKAVRTVGAFVGTRVQFGRTIKDMEGLETPLARMAGFAYLADAVCKVGAKTVDDGGMPSVSAGIAKNHLAQMMEEGLTEGIKILCGKGVISGPSNPLNRDLRSIQVAHAVEGAYYLNEWVIGLQGLMRSHNHARHAVDAMQEGQWGKFLKHAMPIAGNTAVNYTKTMLPSWANAGGQGDVDPQFKHFYNHINRMGKAYNMAANITLMQHQDKLIGRGLTLKRLGDVVSYNYMAACALTEFENKGRPDEERDLLEWSVRYCLHKSEEAFDDFLKNYPKKKVEYEVIDGVTDKKSKKSGLISEFMRASIFPAYQFRPRSWKPDDFLNHRVAASITRPGPIRDNLTSGIYIPTDLNTETMAAFDDALDKWSKASEMMLQAKRAKRDLSEEEKEFIESAKSAQAKVSAVDEFALDAKTLLRSALEHE